MTTDPHEIAPGWMAEFDSADGLLEAARAARAEGFRVEAYAPFHIEGLAQALGIERSPIALVTFIGAVVGGVGGYFMQWYSALIDRPIHVGGRPLHSWPMFVPVTFELMILGAALFAVVAFFRTSRLPRLHHPVFDVDEFELASRNRFFLVLERGEHDVTRSWLEARMPMKILEVPA